MDRIIIYAFALILFCAAMVQFGNNYIDRIANSSTVSNKASTSSIVSVTSVRSITSEFSAPSATAKSISTPAIQAANTLEFAVQKFGSFETCTGSVDDTSAIRLATKAAADSGGGVVVFPTGTCLVSGDILVSGNSIWFRGNGRGATIIQAQNSNINVFHCVAENGLARFHTKFSDLHIAGGFRGIWIDQGCSSTVIDDVILSDPIIGLQINGNDRSVPTVPSISTYVHDLEVNHPKKYGIYTFETAEIYLSAVVVDGNERLSYAAVLFDSHTNAVYGERLNLLASQFGLLIQDIENPTTPASRPSQMFFSTILGDSCLEAGIFIDAGFQIFFEKPWASGSENGPGLLIGINAEELEFDDGTFIFNANDGVRVMGPRVGRLNINGGRAISNSRSKAGVFDGISIASGSENFRIDGFSAYNSLTQGYMNTQRYGIHIEAGNSNHFIITNSLLSGNLAGAVLNEASGQDKVESGLIGSKH